MTDQLERNTKAFNQRTQRFVVPDDGGNFNVQSTVVSFHQQVAQTVGFFCDQNDDTAAARRVKLTYGTFRQRAV